MRTAVRLIVAKKLSSCDRSCESVLRANHFIQIFLQKTKFMEPGKRVQHHASTYVNNVAGTCVHVCARVCEQCSVVLGHTAVLLQMSSNMVRFQVRCCHLAPVSFSQHRCMAARAAQPHLQGQTWPNFLAVEKRGEHSRRPEAERLLAFCTSNSFCPKYKQIVAPQKSTTGILSTIR